MRCAKCRKGYQVWTAVVIGFLMLLVLFGLLMQFQANQRDREREAAKNRPFPDAVREGMEQAVEHPLQNKILRDDDRRREAAGLPPWNKRGEGSSKP